MRLILLVICSYTIVAVSAPTLTCEGWYQPSGGQLEIVTMPVSSQTENNTVFIANYNGYAYQVDWDKNLTTFYTTIESDGKRILFTTGRVPTENHPECFTDLSLPNGPRLSVNCAVK